MAAQGLIILCDEAEVFVEHVERSLGGLLGAVVGHDSSDYRFIV